MIINIIYVHEDCCISQMNIKVLFLNEKKNENVEYTSWRHKIFWSKMRVLQLEGVLQLGGIRYVLTLARTKSSIDPESVVNL